MIQWLKKAWRLWAKSLGERASDDNREADIVAVVRTIFAIINLGTCCLIAANIHLGWEVL
jgi:hypothetical protein